MIAAGIHRVEYDAYRDEIGFKGRAVCVVWVRKQSGVYSDEKRIVQDEDGERYAQAIIAALRECGP